MPYEAREARGFTRKANTGKRSRQWVAVYESSRARGDDEGTAITKANGVVKKQWTKTNPSGRKPRDYRPDEMKVAAVIGFAKAASTSIMEEAKTLVDPGWAPRRIKRWEVMLDRMRRRRDPDGIEKTALKMTASVRLKRLRAGKKVPTHKARDIADLSRRMTSEARRMSVEAGKGPVVSRKALWRKHTRRGGRVDDVAKSFEASRTFAAPASTGQDQSGVRTVQFKVKPAGSAKSRVASKAKRKPSPGKK